MRLDLTVYGGLLVLGLGAAYWASMPTTEGENEDKVKIASIDAKQIAEISLTTKDAKSGVEVVATATKRPEGDRFWIDHTRTEPVKEVPKDPHAAAASLTDPLADAPKAPKVTTEHFLGNEKLDDMVKALDPFVAVRVIGKVDDKQLEEFGLKGATDMLTVTSTDGKVMTLILGKKSYGSRNRFVLEGDGQGRVLLIEDEGTENLERAPLRLFDRRLVSFELADVTKAQVAQGTNVKRLAHTKRDKNGELLWTEDEENAPAKPSFDSWMDKVAKLRLTTYAEAKDEDSLQQTQPFLEITFEKDGKPLDTVRFKKLAGEKPTYWVTSDFLKTHAQLVPARVESIEKDIASIVTDTKS